MLLRLKAKMVRIPMKYFLFSMFTTVALMASNVSANSQNYQVHGFIAQGLIDVNNGDFVNDESKVSPKLTEIGFNASYQLSSKLRLAGQVVYLNGGNRYAEGIRVDYALLDWSVFESIDWQANIYLGRFKNNHWLYSSSRDVPFARPSIILPQSVYFDGFRDIAVGADGAAMKISHSDDDFGNFDFNLSYGTSPVSDRQSDIILSEFALGSIAQDRDIQGSIYWQPPFSSWRFGVSYLDSDFTYKENSVEDMFFDGGFSFHFYTVNALYEGEVWEFSGEIYQEHFITKGFYHPLFNNDPIGQGMYLQSRFKVNNELTLLARYETFYNNKEDKNGEKLSEESGGLIPEYFAYHRDATVGLSYDISSNLRLRFEYHWFQGASRLTPVVLPNPQVNSSKNWNLWAMQLMYWF